MNALRYESGAEVRAGDQVRYRGDLGRVEFVVARKVGDPAIDWYLDQYPNGGFMLESEQFGKVFMPSDEIDEGLELVRREAER